MVQIPKCILLGFVSLIQSHIDLNRFHTSETPSYFQVLQHIKQTCIVHKRTSSKPWVSWASSSSSVGDSISSSSYSSTLAIHSVSRVISTTSVLSWRSSTPASIQLSTSPNMKISRRASRSCCIWRAALSIVILLLAIHLKLIQSIPSTVMSRLSLVGKQRTGNIEDELLELCMNHAWVFNFQ